MKLLILFVLILSVSVASAIDLSYVEQGSYIVFDNGDGTHINLTGQQNFSEFNFVGSTLNITINDSYSVYANTANITLSNISYLNDKLNFTASGTTGVLSISAKMTENNVYYLLKVDNVPNSYNFSTSVGVVFYSWSTWSQHDFSIELANLTSHQDYVFDSVGTYYVTVNATNANGTSQTLNWTISVGISEALAEYSKVEFLWWE